MEIYGSTSFVWFRTFDGLRMWMVAARPRLVDKFSSFQTIVSAVVDDFGDLVEVSK